MTDIIVRQKKTIDKNKRCSFVFELSAFVYRARCSRMKGGPSIWELKTVLDRLIRFTSVTEFY